MIKIIGLRAGHSDNCVGAGGYLDEHSQMKKLYNLVKQGLEAQGYIVIDCNSNGYSANSELSEGANKANCQHIDLFISLHMNASNGQGHGTECWIHSRGCRAEDIARNIVNSISELGFQNRGVKYNPNYYEMRAINAPNIIVETAFCDNEYDSNLFDLGSMANAIIKGISGEVSNISNIVKEEIVVNSNNESEGNYMSKVYANGSTQEIVYSDSECSSRLGSLSPYEKCTCIYEWEGKAVVLYKVDGTDKEKVGFVNWTGGIQ